MAEIAWKQVVCSGCGRRYRCTPTDDYYDATNTIDGLCIGCVAAGLEVHTSTLEVVTLPDD